MVGSVGIAGDSSSQGPELKPHAGGGGRGRAVVARVYLKQKTKKPSKPLACFPGHYFKKKRRKDNRALCKYTAHNSK